MKSKYLDPKTMRLHVNPVVIGSDWIKNPILHGVHGIPPHCWMIKNGRVVVDPVKYNAFKSEKSGIIVKTSIWDKIFFWRKR